MMTTSKIKTASKLKGMFRRGKRFCCLHTQCQTNCNSVIPPHLLFKIIITELFLQLSLISHSKKLLTIVKSVNVASYSQFSVRAQLLNSKLRGFVQNLFQTRLVASALYDKSGNKISKEFLARVTSTRLISIESQPKKIVVVVVVVIGVHIVVVAIPVVDPRNIPLKFG